MKRLVTDYVFDASAGQVTLAEYASIDIASLLLITNVTDNVVIYNFAEPAKGGAAVGDTVSLDYDTSAMDDTDILQIWYFDPAAAQPISDNGASLTVDGAVSVSNFPATQPVSGTVTVNALPAGTNNIGDVDVVTMPVVQVGDNSSSLTIDGTVGTQQTGTILSGSTSTIQNGFIASTDVSAYDGFSIQLSGTFGGTVVKAEVSNDNTTWYASAEMHSVLSASTNPITNMTATGMWASPLRWKYLRVSTTAISSGTVTATLFLRSGITPTSSILARIDTLPQAALYTGSSGSGDSGSVALVADTNTRQYVYNGASWDRERCNEAVTLLASGGRTTTQTSASQVNYSGLSALIVVVDVTSAGTGSITVSVEGMDPASGKFYAMLTGGLIITNSTNVYRVGANVPAVANATAQDYIPRTFRVVVTANNANSMTYSVGYTLVR